MLAEVWWQVEGPEGNTGRRGGNKAHLFAILFSRCALSRVLALALFLSCVGCCVVVVSHRKQPAATAGVQAQSAQSVSSAKSSSQQEGGAPRPRRAASRKGL